MTILESAGNTEFYMTSTYTIDDLHRVQARSLEMFHSIKRVLDDHGIDYTLGYGSLLGQARHGGFIPWDDDIDLFIMDYHYARAILALRAELPKDLLLHSKRNDPIYWVKWVKVRDLKSSTVESLWKIDNKFRFHGICIDLIRVTESTLGQKRHTPRIQELTTSMKSDLKRKKPVDGRRRVGVLISKTTTSLVYKARIGYHRLLRKLERKRILVSAPGTVIERTFDYNHMFPITTNSRQFEGISVNSPHKPQLVLQALYGDWEALPPLEKRVPHFESVRFFDE